MDLQIDFFYTTSSTNTSQYGTNRSSSVNAFVGYAGGANSATVYRGDGTIANFLYGGTGGGSTFFALILKAIRSRRSCSTAPPSSRRFLMGAK